MSFDRDTLLAAVRASPDAVARHDRAFWLSLFSRDAEINDPEGSRPHRGSAAIARFYDTFIAPNGIVFEPDHDLVCGQTVVRDLVIVTTLPTGLVVPVPTHIRYELVAEDGRPRIRRLHAHWELLPMVLKTLGSGWAGIRSYAGLSLHMLRCQGLGGVFGFLRGFGGTGRAGRRRMTALLDALAAGDGAAVDRALGADARIEAPAGQAADSTALQARCQGLRWRKLTAAGRWVSATVETDAGRGVLMGAFGAPAEVRLYVDAD